MACQLRPNSHIFEPRAGEYRWWEGDAGQFPYWSATQPHPHIIFVPGLLNRDQCKLLVECFEWNRTAATRTSDKYWDGRFIWSNQIPRSEVAALRLMQQIRHFSTLKLMERFSPDRFLYSDTAQLVHWPPGVELTPHADNINPEGTPNNTAHRAYSSILYLNDDYEGGETFFPGHGVRVKPEPGLLVLFGAGCDYVHGVTRVVRGQRYTYAGWFTHDANWQDAEANVVF
ncbi:MAG: 2OG-Fe(II) oxygenase [Pseudomonadota bacterium]